MKAMTRLERERFLEAAETFAPRFAALFRTLASTGMRLGECSGFNGFDRALRSTGSGSTRRSGKMERWTPLNLATDARWICPQSYPAAFNVTDTAQGGGRGNGEGSRPRVWCFVQEWGRNSMRPMFAQQWLGCSRKQDSRHTSHPTR